MNQGFESTRTQVLPEHIIRSEAGEENLDDTDFYVPGLSDIRQRLESLKCNKCGSQTRLSFGVFGSVQITCGSVPCGLSGYSCPICIRVYAKQQNVVKHFRSCHSDLIICPMCSQVLPKANGDKVKHLCVHISSSIVMVQNQFDNSHPFNEEQRGIEEFPNNQPPPRGLSDEDDSQEENNGLSDEDDDLEPDLLENEEGQGLSDGDDHMDMDSPPPLLTNQSESNDNEVVSYDESVNEEEEEEEGEGEYVNERIYNHYMNIINEFEFFDKPDSEKYKVVINPIEPYPKNTYGIFLDKPNLTLIKYARKCDLSKLKLQELIDDLGEVYLSPCNFYSSETLTKKVHQLSNERGIKFEKKKCPNNHLVCIIPLKEGLKVLFSNEDFVREFHVKEWEIGEDQPFMHFRQSEKFISEARRARSLGCHYISILANRDSFPAYLTAHLPLKGYYYSIGNLDYPEVERHVIVFGFGLECKGCLRTVEKAFVENVNELSTTPFLIKHPISGQFVRFITEFDVEVDDTPQVSENLMTKGHTARLFCSDCGEHVSRRINPSTYHQCKSKTLEETEKLYNECCGILEGARRGDGSIARVNRVEDRTGRCFTTSVYDTNLRHNITILKQPTSFFLLNGHTKKNLINPPGPFHSVVKGYILHVKDGVKDKQVTSEYQRQQIKNRWKSFEFPKGIKKPKDLWGIGGSNFDAILSLVYGFPESCEGILPSLFCRALKANFGAIIVLFTPGYSRNVLRFHRKTFMDTIAVIGRHININFPTTHQVFHVWDRVVPPTNPGPIPNVSLPGPPNGPILITNVSEREKVVGIGPSRTWNEKKYEVKHRRFKSKMRSCFLRNPSVFLVKEYVADETLSIFFPDRKWKWFSSQIRYTILIEFYLTKEEKREVMEYLKIAAWGVDQVGFLGVKEVQVRTKVFRRSHKIVCGNDAGTIEKMIHVSWNGGFGYEKSSIVVIIAIIGTGRKRIHEIENAKGKPVLNNTKVMNIIV